MIVHKEQLELLIIQLAKRQIQKTLITQSWDKQISEIRFELDDGSWLSICPVHTDQRLQITISQPITMN